MKQRYAVFYACVILSNIMRSMWVQSLHTYTSWQRIGNTSIAIITCFLVLIDICYEWKTAQTDARLRQQERILRESYETIDLAFFIPFAMHLCVDLRGLQLPLFILFNSTRRKTLIHFRRELFDSVLLNFSVIRARYYVLTEWGSPCVEGQIILHKFISDVETRFFFWTWNFRTWNA